MSVGGALRAWVALWDRREPPTALALVRILVGACFLADLLYVHGVGLADLLWAPPPDGLGYGVNARSWSVRWFGAGTDAVLFWGTAAAALAFMLGALTRVAGVALVLGSAQLAVLLPDGDRGIDAALRVVTLVLVLSHSHARWSVDAVVRGWLGRPFPALVPAWPRLLLFAQVVWIYFSGGHNKAGSEWWPQGDFAALANVLSDPHYARFAPDWVPTAYPLLQLATAVTMLFEMGAPLLLLFAWYEATAERGGRLRRLCNRLHLRHVWIAIGVAFHVGIAIFLKLGVFPWGMLALYPVLLRPDELRRIEAWLTGLTPPARGPTLRA